MIDCDKFKEINDNFGHQIGDLTLKNISKALKLTFRQTGQTDIAGRIGGDEFCVYVHDVPSENFIRLKCKQLTELIQKLNKDFPISISIGIAILEKEITYEDALKRADDAMYQAKKNGGGQIVIYKTP